MSASVQMLLNYGKYHRIWPFFDTHQKKLYVTIALLRPLVEPICELLVSEDYGQSWKMIADFHFMDERNTTTGQPFVTNDGIIFVPVWNAGFYTHGETWLAIYKSDDQGLSWTKVYEDPKGTYGKHFFQNPFDASLYLGVGVEGGGDRSRVSSTPARSYLLCSKDYGKSWRKILKVDYPTALYSGTAIDDKTVIVTAREKKSVFRTVNGVSWTETHLGNTARSASHFESLGKTVISSNSSIFVSTDGISWIRLNAPIKWLMLRYPTLHRNRIYLAGVGGRSIVLSTSLKKWYIAFDTTKVADSNLFSRMTLADDYVFLGNELNGVLLRMKLSTNGSESIGASQLLETNLRSFLSFSKYIAKSLLTRNVLLF